MSIRTARRLRDRRFFRVTDCLEIVAMWNQIKAKEREYFGCHWFTEGVFKEFVDPDMWRVFPTIQHVLQVNDEHHNDAINWACACILSRRLRTIHDSMMRLCVPKINRMEKEQLSSFVRSIQ